MLADIDAPQRHALIKAMIVDPLQRQFRDQFCEFFAADILDNLNVHDAAIVRFEEPRQFWIIRRDNGLMIEHRDKLRLEVLQAAEVDDPIPIIEMDRAEDDVDLDRVAMNEAAVAMLSAPLSEGAAKSRIMIVGLAGLVMVPD